MAFKPKLSNFTPQGKFLATPLLPNDLAIKDEQTNYNNTLGHNDSRSSSTRRVNLKVKGSSLAISEKDEMATLSPFTEKHLRKLS